MDELSPPRLAGGRRSRRVLGAMAALGLAVILMLVNAAGASVLGQEDGPRLLYLPMRWCVLEGSLASRQDPDAAVLERIRRASSILAPEAGITLRSPVNTSLGETLGFPVIKDPRKRPGRLGDVRTPVESTTEYRLVISRCEQAWQRMERLAGKQVSFGGLAKGPIAVIIRDFVNGSGTPVNNVWGYAMAASVDRSYCNASLAPVGHATGGSLIVVDSEDGHPDRVLDRRLVAHEIGHILLLGHGNGLDDPGSQPNRIDKWCDATENPDIIPGSLMTYSLRYENMESWQQRLTRHVVARHPAAMVATPFLRPRAPQTRVRQLERLANGGSRVTRRLIPPTRRPLSPLTRLWSAGVRGDDFADRPFDVKTKSGKSASPTVDLDRVTISEDVDSGDLVLAMAPAEMATAEAAAQGEQVAGTVLDVDGDPGTGGSPSTVPGHPLVDMDGVSGVELVGVARVIDGEMRAQAWRWIREAESWQEILPPPEVEVTVRTNEEQHGPSEDQPEPSEGGPTPIPDTIVMTIPAGLVDLSPDFMFGAVLRTPLANGKTFADTVPSDPTSGLAAMSKRDVDYPVCAVNRDTASPGTAELGEPVTLEVDGFGRSGRVSVWLGDREKPVAHLRYTEMPCDCPWVGELTLPKQLDLPTESTDEQANEAGGSAASAEPDGRSPEPSPSPSAGTDGSAAGLYMVQVVLDGTGLTADCPVIIGNPEMAEWYRQDEATAVPSS